MIYLSDDTGPEIDYISVSADREGGKWLDVQLRIEMNGLDERLEALGIFVADFVESYLDGMKVKA